MEHFCLKRGEEALDHRVVPTIAGTAHRAPYAKGEQPLLIARRHILAPAIGMMQEPHRHGALLPRHLEGPQRQGRGHLIPHRPADNAARIEIHQHRDIEPAVARGDVGDVTRPLLVRPGRSKLSPQGIRRSDLRGCPCPGSPDPAAADTSDSMKSHQSGDAMTAHPDPLGLQILVNPRTAVPASRRLITGTNLRHDQRSKTGIGGDPSLEIYLPAGGTN